LDIYTVTTDVLVLRLVVHYTLSKTVMCMNFWLYF